MQALLQFYRKGLSNALVLMLSIAALFYMVRFISAVEIIGPDDPVKVEWRYAIDSTSVLRIEDIKGGRNLDPVDSPFHVPLTYQNATYWLGATITNESLSSRTVSLFVDNPLLEVFDAYLVDDSGNFTKTWSLGYGDRAHLHSDPTENCLCVELPARTSKTLYLKLYSPQLPVLPIVLMTEGNSELLALNSHLIWGAFVGVMLIMMIYNTAIYYSVRNPVYLVFVGYLASLLVLMAVVYGFGGHLFPGNVNVYLKSHVSSVVFLSLYFALDIARRFLNYEKQEGVFRYLVNWTLYVMFLMTILSAFTGELFPIEVSFFFQGLTYLVLVIISIVQMRATGYWSLFYLTSWLPKMIGGVWLTLMCLNVLEYSVMGRYGFMAGIVLEVAILALALGERVRKQQERSLHKITHDPITMLPNNTVAEDFLWQIISEDKRFCVCLIRLEGYDTLSPYLADGDKSLYISTVVERADRILRDSRAFEFESTNRHSKYLACISEGILCFVIDGGKNASPEPVIDDVLNSVDGVVQLDNFAARIRGQVGVSRYPVDASNPKILIREALQALEQNRVQTNRISYFNSIASHHHKANLTLMSDLKSAIENSELELYHQPQISLNTEAIHGSEVLLRWRHPKYGYVAPDVFVDLAERVGLINDLSLWVISQAFKQQSTLINQGYFRRLSINISCRDLDIPELPKLFVSLSKQHKVPLHLVSLELTESVMVTDYPKLKQLFDDLSSCGVEVSIDDYGTGYSSLNYLSELPFTELKIDKTFVQNIVRSQRKQNIVRATVDMAHSLGVMVVAEGVEDKETEAMLKSYHVDVGQGYFYAKPLPFEQYREMLRRLEPSPQPQWDVASSARG
ncbi:EAL domain-containing protein [Parasalinivibrio latis]|uniref:EAL domain-containing protein n=1 Tax=Parasalinivibrio latis TaxID=2952610 RepID=UPI0030E566EB